MCSEVLNELTLFSQELQRSLSPQALQQLARKLGFVQRTNKYQAKDLIALCVWLSQKVASCTSLTQLCSSLESSTGVLISPEGPNQRFNPSAVKLLQHVFTSLLTQKLYTSQALPQRYVAQFQRIRILDSANQMDFSVLSAWVDKFTLIIGRCDNFLDCIFKVIKIVIKNNTRCKKIEHNTLNIAFQNQMLFYFSFDSI